MKKLKLFGSAPRKDQTGLYALTKILNGQMARLRFCVDCEESKKKNYGEKIHKVDDILNNWRNKRLTLIGKIEVIKALAASQLVYVLSSTTSCLKSLKETNNLLFKFLWDNKGDKIKRTEMIVDYQDGGQKMLDIIEFNKALKISWILKYISSDCKSKWKCFFFIFSSI